MIECESVRAVALLPELLHRTRVPSHDSVRLDIAEQKKADAAEYGALRICKALCNLVDSLESVQPRVPKSLGPLSVRIE